MGNDTLKLIIQERKGTLFDGSVESVSSINEIGAFDILPEHEQFVSAISQFIIARTGKNSEKRWNIDAGIIRVKENTIEIYLGI